MKIFILVFSIAAFSLTATAQTIVNVNTGMSGLANYFLLSNINAQNIVSKANNDALSIEKVPPIIYTSDSGFFQPYDSIVHWKWNNQTGWDYYSKEYGFKYENNLLVMNYHQFLSGELDKYSNSYNEAGVLLEKKKEIKDSADWALDENTVWEFDSIGNLLKYIHIRSQASYGEQTRYQYDSSGKVSSQLNMTLSNSVWDSTSRDYNFYDSLGRNVKTVSKKYHSGGIYYDSVVRTYNDQNQLLCELFGNSSVCRTYNTKGLLWEIEREWYDGYHMRFANNTYYYDSLDRVIRFYSYEWGRGSYEIFYTYDSVGDMIHQFNDYTGVYSPSWQYFNQYDTRHNLIRRIEQEDYDNHNQWKTLSETNSTYDINNELISWSKHDDYGVFPYGDSLYKYYNSGIIIDKMETLPDLLNTVEHEGKIVIHAISEFEPLSYLVDSQPVQVTNDTIQDMKAGMHQVVVVNSEGRILVKVVKVEGFDPYGESENKLPVINTWPIPVSNNLYLEIENYNNHSGTAEILSSSGQLLKRISISERRMEIDLNVLSAGVYFLKVNTGDGILVKKIIKL